MGTTGILINAPLSPGAGRFYAQSFPASPLYLTGKCPRSVRKAETVCE